MMKLTNFTKSNVITLLLRCLIIVVVVGLLRAFFYIYNADLIQIESWSNELPALLKGAFIFDASNLSITFGLFVIFSLIPFRFRSDKRYQSFLFICFMIGIIVLVVLNITDTIYFHYAQKRITSDEFSYFNNSNTALIMLISILENWYMLLLGIALILGSAWLYKKIKHNRSECSQLAFYISNSLFLIVMVFVLIIAIRGGVSRAIRPITLSNALQFSESPSKAYIVLNNPFCIIKTLNKDQNNYSKYFAEQELDSLYYPSHKGSNQQQMKRKNVVIFILESFSYEHSAFLNPQLYPDGTKYTPFLDSLMQRGYIFDKCFANGRKSIDALPSVLVSIPPIKNQLSQPSFPKSVPKPFIGESG
jgi:hypothetical protein